mgnify:CR=1 FL=1
MTQTQEDLRQLVREKYGEAALNVLSGNKSGCCGTGNDTCGARPLDQGVEPTNLELELRRADILDSPAKRLRCNACGEVFTAEEPEAGPQQPGDRRVHGHSDTRTSRGRAPNGQSDQLCSCLV